MSKLLTTSTLCTVSSCRTISTLSGLHIFTVRNRASFVIQLSKMAGFTSGSSLDGWGGGGGGGGAEKGRG